MKIRNKNEPLSNIVLNAWNRASRNSADTSEWDRHLLAVRDEAGFHWRGGLYFRRLPEGSVRITYFHTYNSFPTYAAFEIPSLEWASVISTVSEIGETSDNYKNAIKFHAPDTKEKI